MNYPWRNDSRFTLLENGVAYFPRVMQAISQASTEILIETFILFDDKVGRALRQSLIDAATRGVQVDLTIDGYGSDSLSDEFVKGLTDSGVRLHVFDPRPRFLGLRTNLFRRMHRKIVGIDGQLAFIGGINFSADHLPDFGPQAKQDYSVEVQGTLAVDICDFARAALIYAHTGRQRRRKLSKKRLRLGDASGRLVIRDNNLHRDDIEHAYLDSIRAARHDILIANAYFFPGYRLLRALAAASRRGVNVRLVLQGEPDMPIAKLAGTMLYEYLNDAGVLVYEYCKCPLHGKVACIDEKWSTVGSSNLDPLSLALNLEANILIHDSAFNSTLRKSLDRLIAEECSLVPRSARAGGHLRRLWGGVVVFHFLRRFPKWAGSLPAHKPRLQTIVPDDYVDPEKQETV